MPAVRVHIPGQEYAVEVAPGLLRRLGELVARVAPHEKALLAVDAKIADTHGAIAGRSLEEIGYQVTLIELTAAEREKTLPTVRRLYDAMLAAKLERRSPVIALGGGVVGDTAGFAAATYLRGAPLIHAPTTLLAMVDASIGGKTGVNIDLPDGSLGKNLIGAFWQPKIVVADPDALATLTLRDYRCGLAECVKHGLIASAEHVSFIEANAEALASSPRGESEMVSKLAADSASIKARIVESDVRESGRRALLNLGHTFAHAIEPIETLDLRHGEAVSIGLVAAMSCSVATGRLSPDERDSIRSLLRHLGLPVEVREAIDHERLVEAMTYDKKVQDGRLRLVLPVGIGAAEVADDVPLDVIRDAWREVGAS